MTTTEADWKHDGDETIALRQYEPTFGLSPWTGHPLPSDVEIINDT